VKNFRLPICDLRFPKAEKIFIFWSYVPEFWSKAIVRITGNQLPDKSDRWSHMGIIFQLGDGSSEYYEALFEEGFVGPKPLSALVEKLQDKKGELSIGNADIREVYVPAIYELCKGWVGKKGYNQWQLASMWFFERFGRWLGIPVPRSPDKVVCSEVVARLVYPHIDLRDETRTEFDEVNPNSAWRKFINGAPRAINGRRHPRKSAATGQLEKQEVCPLVAGRPVFIGM